MLTGVALSAAMTAVAVVAAMLQWWWLLTLAAMVLLSGAFLFALDADRRVRSLPTWATELARRTVASHKPPKPPKPPAPVVVAAPATEQDVLGAVRVLQAQYIGRLDRLQTSIEHELELLRAHSAERDERGEATTDANVP
ncbi:hypothetical protein [Pseudactinotalea sp.]|uniref:hypothetical protein n=1 Tax=Pseudactinotalea sp. TaxID=1926260 RepID=UPI003B3A6B8C